MAKSKKEIDKDWLYEQYVTNRRSTPDIAREVGCTAKTVNNNLRRYDIGLRTFSESQVIDTANLELLNNREWLYDQYISQNKSTKNIGESLGYGAKMVLRHIKMHGIELKSNNKAQSILENRNIMYEYYVTNRLSANAIADIIGTTSRTVLSFLKRHSIPIRSNSEAKLHHCLDVLGDYEWLYYQYITMDKTAQQISNELGISDITVANYLKKQEISLKYSVGYSCKAISWLNSMMDASGLFIQHAMNGGEYCIPNTRYRVDGYCSENNTVYEFHGDCFHGNPDVFAPEEYCHPFNNKTAGELYSATKHRENEIISLGYNLVVVWESDYMLNTPIGVVRPRPSPVDPVVSDTQY